jgi:hypothetical protein
MRQPKPELKRASRYGRLGSALDCRVRVGGYWDFRFIECPNGWMANTSEEIVGAQPILPGSKPVLPMEKHDGERPNLEVAVRALRRLLFATWILSGLAFALVCYAEMLGVVQVD